MFRCIKNVINVAMLLFLSAQPFNHVAAEEINKELLKGVVLKVFVYPVGAPHAYLSEDLFHPQGLDVDIIYELQNRLGFELAENRIYPIDIKLGFERLKNGDADILGGGISYTKEREEVVDYTPIFYHSSMTVLYDKERFPNGAKLDDFKGKKLGFLAGTTSENFIKKLGADAEGVSSNIFGYFAITTGRIDGYIYDRPPLADFAHNMPTLHLEVSDERFGEDLTQFALAMPKESPFNKLISYELENMIKDGTIDALLKKWEAD